jgi:hypothetical protein
LLRSKSFTNVDTVGGDVGMREKVGEVEGAEVGIVVGAAVGKTVGATLGIEEGCKLGITVG